MIIRIILEDTLSAISMTFFGVVWSWQTAVYLEP